MLPSNSESLRLSSSSLAFASPCNVTPRLKAVLSVQRLARGYVARNRVAGRRQALAMLRSACLGVAMDIVESYIREVRVCCASSLFFRSFRALRVFFCRRCIRRFRANGRRNSFHSQVLHPFRTLQISNRTSCLLRKVGRGGHASTCARYKLTVVQMASPMHISLCDTKGSHLRYSAGHYCCGNGVD